MTDAATEKFAALLRELKDRSGRSYGALAARLHVSTSTLHRYCNGDAVPADYAPVERLARLCGATPEELVELHRRWLRADAPRRRPPTDSATRPAPPSWAASDTPDTPDTPDTSGPSAPAAPPSWAAGQEASPGPAEPDSPSRAAASAPAASGPAPSAPAGASTPAGRRAWWRRRRVTLPVAAAGAAVLVLVVTTSSGSPDDGPGDRGGRAGTSAVPEVGGGQNAPRALPQDGKSSVGSGSPAESGKGAGSGAGERNGAVPGGAAGDGTAETPQKTDTPLAWSVRSHLWEYGCDHRYVLDKPASDVPPPPLEQDAESWALSQGAVHGGTTNVEAVLEPRGSQPVTIKAVHVRTAGRAAPLQWSAFAMSDGCGGEITEAEYRVDLDAPRPVLHAEDGWDGNQTVSPPALPFQVTPTEPLSLLVHAATEAYDVSWYLEVEWSSGDSSGVIRLDDDGSPFRTSAIKGRPLYSYRLESGGWVKSGSQDEEAGPSERPSPS